MAYNNAHKFSGNDNFGASLQSYVKLARSKGYELVGTNISVVNAFFVKESLASDLFAPLSAEQLFNPIRYDLITAMKGGHVKAFVKIYNHV